MVFPKLDQITDELKKRPIVLGAVAIGVIAGGYVLVRQSANKKSPYQFAPPTKQTTAGVGGSSNGVSGATDSVGGSTDTQGIMDNLATQAESFQQGVSDYLDSFVSDVANQQSGFADSLSSQVQSQIDSITRGIDSQLAGLSSSYVNDLPMSVYPNAPIENTTAIPVSLPPVANTINTPKSNPVTQSVKGVTTSIKAPIKAVVNSVRPLTLVQPPKLKLPNAPSSYRNPIKNVRNVITRNPVKAIVRPKPVTALAKTTTKTRTK